MVAAALAVAPVALLWAASAAEYSVEYPQDYRTWTHVMSYVIGSQSPAFEKSGGLHNFYANDKALEGYRAGKFPDGSVLIDERNKAEDKDGVTRTGDRLGVAVMIKDSRRYAETGGWGFEVFAGNDPPKSRLNGEGRMRCFNCHSQQRDHDFVFTELRD
jgi:opacity protein-like surface antigen